MRNANIILGAIWWGLAYAPILSWYLWRKDGIKAMKDVNPWYFRAWNNMWIMHNFVFQLPAIIAPLTGLGNYSINQMYIYVNYLVGTVIGGATTAFISLLFLVAYATYTEPDATSGPLK